MDHGFFRARAASPRLRVADPAYNGAAMAEELRLAAGEGAQLVLFPELSVTGYTCGDLFLQERLLAAAVEALSSLAAEGGRLGIPVVAGLPVLSRGRLWNCAAVLDGGRVAGLVPKTCIPDYKEFYEGRWFARPSPADAGTVDLGRPGWESVPFGTDLLFRARPAGGRPFLFGVEICEDLWVPLPPSSFQALRGAVLLLNASASNEIVGKAEYRRSLVLGQSGRCVAACLYAGAGPGESSTDLFFSGHGIACEYGTLLAESDRFRREGTRVQADFDLARLETERARLSSFGDQAGRAAAGAFGSAGVPPAGRTVDVDAPAFPMDRFARVVEPHPFVPSDEAQRDARCREIFSIQAGALAKRLEHAGCRTAVVGISGGLDSALALLVAARAMDLLGRPRTDVLAVTMPGFGTSAGTLRTARDLMAAAGARSREVDIKAACEAHLRDIGHDPALRDVTYENAQARERTQILMDLANREGGLVVGTGDLSEAALGWSTYNGDHMSMYAVNAGVPKTLVRHLVAWVAGHGADPALEAALRRVLDTPISPELLPPDASGRIAQRTEDLLGPYELHDFFLYYHARWGCPPEKILFLAEKAFAGRYGAAEISRWFAVFRRRFFASQFKRSCVPDGPKVGSLSLSPRGDWRMPSDASPAAWE